MTAQPTTTAPVTADALVRLLRARHPSPAWAFFPEFRESTGHDVRTLDALAVGLFPSAGLEVHGFEVKVSRGDLLREIKDPAKSDAIGRFCNRFWLVVPDASVVAGIEHEMPATWGIMVRAEKTARSEERLRVAKKAERLTGIGAAHVRGFVASLARRVGGEEAVPRRDFDRLVAEEVAKKREEDRRFYERQIEWRAKDAEARAERAETALQKFNDAVGDRIEGWNAEKIGGAVRVVLESKGAVEQSERAIRTALADLERAAEACRRALPKEARP